MASSMPTGSLYAYDIARRQRPSSNRPDNGRPYVYANRAMRLDGKGVSRPDVGHEGAAYGAPCVAAIFNHVHYWDPATRRLGRAPAGRGDRSMRSTPRSVSRSEKFCC